MDAGIRQRVGLWLRSERAFGQALVPLQNPSLRAPAPAGRAAARAAPRAQPAPRPAAAPPRTSVATPVRPSTPAPPAPAPSPAAAPPPAPANVIDMTQPFTAPLLSSTARRQALDELDRLQVRTCTACGLHASRTQTVFGEGSPDAELMFIGEGPGQTEDETGRPFVGAAGQKLNDMIRGMGLEREQVFIANIVKCRPPGNRVPAPNEVAACAPFLVRQIEIIRPRVIVTLGLPSTRFLLRENLPMARMRGQWHAWRGIRVMPTYHPAYMLRNYTREVRAAVWSDLQQVMKELGLPAQRATG
jgi:uracil-DNA glycosylase